MKKKPLAIIIISSILSLSFGNSEDMADSSIKKPIDPISFSISSVGGFSPQDKSSYGSMTLCSDIALFKGDATYLYLETYFYMGSSLWKYGNITCGVKHNFSEDLNMSFLAFARLDSEPMFDFGPQFSFFYSHTINKVNVTLSMNSDLVYLARHRDFEYYNTALIEPTFFENDKLSFGPSLGNSFSVDTTSTKPISDSLYAGLWFCVGNLYVYSMYSPTLYTEGAFSFSHGIEVWAGYSF